MEKVWLSDADLAAVTRRAIRLAKRTHGQGRPGMGEAVVGEALRLLGMPERKIVKSRGGGSRGRGDFAWRALHRMRHVGFRVDVRQERWISEKEIDADVEENKRREAARKELRAAQEKEEQEERRAIVARWVEIASRKYTGLDALVGAEEIVGRWDAAAELAGRWLGAEQGLGARAWWTEREAKKAVRAYAKSLRSTG